MKPIVVSLVVACLSAPAALAADLTKIADPGLWADNGSAGDFASLGLTGGKK